MSMIIKRVPISSVIPWDKNPRGVKEQDLERLKRQILRLGVYKPLLVCQEKGKYIALGGNMFNGERISRLEAIVERLVDIPSAVARQTEAIIAVEKQGEKLDRRLRALRALGVKEIEISIVNAKTEKEKIEYALSDNDRVGYYETEALAALLQPHLAKLELDDYRVDIGRAVDLASILGNLGPELDEKADQVPEISEGPAKTKRGEIIQLGRHRLMCGDSTKAEDVARLMGKEKANLVFTDPPYNVDYGASKNHPNWKIRTIANDNMDDAAWLKFNQAIIEIIKAYSRGGDTYIWGASGPAGMRQRLALIDAGFHWSATIIWKKQQLVLSPAKYQRLYEPCFYGWLKKSSFRGDRKQTEIWEANRPVASDLHPTMKPVELCARGIVNSSKPGQIVLDLFLGSGSTLVASEISDRVCYGMEIDPKYCDVIIQRYAKFTGISEAVIRKAKR